MYLFKHKNGIYQVIYKQANGKYTRITTKTKLKSEANKFLAEFMSEIVRLKERGHNSIDLRAFIYLFNKHSEAIHRPKTTESFKWVFKDLQKYLGNPLIHEITLKQTQDFLNFKRKVSVYTAQKYLAYLRSAFNHALKNNYITKNHFKDIPNFRIPEKQPKYFSPDEYQLLLDSVRELWFRDVIEIAYNTGMRQNEILTIQWSQVDLENKAITLDNHAYVNKSKKVRQIYLSKRANEIMSRLYQFKDCELVFHNNFRVFKQDHISKKFKKHVRSVDINQSLNFHSLRHTFASRLVQKGVSIYLVSKLLGHADIKTTEIYAHLRSDDLRESVEMLN
jgi:integrase